VNWHRIRVEHAHTEFTLIVRADGWLSRSRPEEAKTLWFEVPPGLERQAEGQVQSLRSSCLEGAALGFGVEQGTSRPIADKRNVRLSTRTPWATVHGKLVAVR
jgi:hypothetical protein